jgi:hypothetical protein
MTTVQSFGICEANFSFAVCGGRENRWVAYAFDDTESDHEDLSEEFDDDFNCDPIASKGLVNTLPAEPPIWDPREYFLTVVARRVCQAADSWESLIRAIDRKVKDYVSHHHCGLPFQLDLVPNYVLGKHASFNYI